MLERKGQTPAWRRVGLALERDAPILRAGDRWLKADTFSAAQALGEVVGKFPGMTEDEERDFIESRRASDFLAYQSPRVYLFYARQHRYAADTLYGVGYAASESKIQRMLSRVDEGKSGPMDAEQTRLMWDTGLIRSYYLLAGYALENCLKGLIVAQVPGRIRGDKLSEDVKGHDLCKLAETGGVSLSPDERELLELISRHIVWGKYPVPTQLEKMPSPVDPDAEKMYAGNVYIKRRVQVLANDVFDRVAAEIIRLAPPE